jgi:hypothetical protein
MHQLYAVMWLATWGNNMAWLESVAVTAGAVWIFRDRVGRRLAAWWASHHGTHATAHYLAALREHQRINGRDGGQDAKLAS